MPDDDSGILNFRSLLAPDQLSTERLILRRWRESDCDTFSRMNDDARVMEFFPRHLTAQETKNSVEKICRQFETHGFGLWAVEIKETGEFIGYVGLNAPTFEASFMPCVEIGWRLDCNHWGKGYAPEAAQVVLRDGFERVGLDEILSWTAVVNSKSIRVMHKIGMKSDPRENFLHPLVADEHLLKPHVLYRLTKTEWHSRQLSAGKVTPGSRAEV